VAQSIEHGAWGKEYREGILKAESHKSSKLMAHREPSALGGALRFGLEAGGGENRWTAASLARGTMGVRGRESKARKLRRRKANPKEDGRKENNSIRTIERSESLSPGLFVVPLLSEAVFLLPSVFSQRSKGS